MSELITDYIEKAKRLSKEQRERVLSRMDGKLPKRFLKQKITEIEAVAQQLALEDEQLTEWRERMSELREKEEKAKRKSEEKQAKSKEKNEDDKKAE